MLSKKNMRQVSETRWPYVLHQGRCDSLMNALSAAVGGNGLLIWGCDRHACSGWAQLEGWYDGKGWDTNSARGRKPNSIIHRAYASFVCAYVHLPIPYRD